MGHCKNSILSIAFATVIVSSLLAGCNSQGFGKPCEGYNQSEIYCYGDFLLTVQRAKLYPDQKTFVDRPLLKNPDEVLAQFKLLNMSGENLDANQKQILSDFIESNFDRNGTEFEEWIPDDWEETPTFLADINDEHLRQWASELHSFWKELGRKIRLDVKLNSSRHSMYYVSHPVIVPGGRFKEFYYWDSYWIQKGLLVSNMTSTVKGMIQNFLEMVEELGFVPNGGRIYYQRSQPPLLIPMVDSYYETTKDLDFVRDNIKLLIKEYNFFMQNRTIGFNYNGRNYVMAHYNNELTDPRPESFSEDYELVESLANATPEEKEVMYANLKSGAESGWDFSSRWFVVPDGTSFIDGELKDTKTRDILPVDLNSFLYWNSVLLTKFCILIDDLSLCNPEEFQRQSVTWKDSIRDVFYDEEAGAWFDFDFVRGQRRKHFYPTNLAPLWVGAAHGDMQVIARKIVDYLHLSGATNFPGGIPTSMLHTGLQWDFPNGWPPLNHLVVEALDNTGEPAAQELAFQLAKKWVQSNHLAYLKYDKAMFEKYDITELGGVGGGGEYEVVVGFGWSNGVVLDFLRKYGAKLESLPDLPIPSATSNLAHLGSRRGSSGSSIDKSSGVVVTFSIVAFFLKYSLRL